jgi:hypothetical protein
LKINETCQARFLQKEAISTESPLPKGRLKKVSLKMENENMLYIKKYIYSRYLSMKVLCAFICVILSFLLPSTVLSDIIIHDIVAPAGKEVMLKAEVKGKLFRKGGELVEFFINGKSIGKSLSGGDGFAFKQFFPSKTGKYQIKAMVNKEEGRGLLISLRRNSRIIFVDVEGGLLERFSDKPRQGSQKAIRAIQKRFPVVLLQTGLLNIKSIKTWLKKNEFPELPLIPWGQGAVFTELVEEGFKLRAVIGSSDVIESAREYKPLAFSFEEVEDAVEVKDWEEIRKKLK